MYYENVNKTSKYIGVYIVRRVGRYAYKIVKDGKHIRSKYFDDEEKCARERDHFIRKYKIKNTVLNFYDIDYETWLNDRKSFFNYDDEMINQLMDIYNMNKHFKVKHI